MMVEFLQRNPRVATAFVALAAVFGAMVVHRLARAVLRRLVRGSLMLQSMLTATERAGSAVLPLLALMAVWQAAPNDLPFIGTVRHMNGLLLIGAMTWWFMSFINGFAEGVLARHPSTVEDNLNARRIQTQTKVLSRSAMVIVLIAGTAMALMTFPGARRWAPACWLRPACSASSAAAARPVFSNLIAGLQLALAQPIRLDDVLIVKGEWGRVEEITGTYVVLKIWDERRLIIPLQWFIENPFENWTRTGSQILGTVFLYRTTARRWTRSAPRPGRITEAAPEWDQRVFGVQVTDASERAMQVRILVSAANSGAAFDLRCKLREGVLAFPAREYPGSLPQVRSPQPVMEPAAA
ncbi:mechanosensitive ion channel [Ramlibacter terrae]|uniref:Mechanosensitive ion channel n=1 Tax=Ramlibacter terrae TaxID=2732511 RepID=A0ABX6P5Z9_9BURK|nr:mechanosensitive ion channel [Ramlibacter terrae]